MYDFPRLREPLISTILAGLCFILAWKVDRLPEWLRLFLTLLGIVFSATALVTGVDFLTYRISERIRDLKAAPLVGPERFALALKGLTMSQTDMVNRMVGQSIYGIPGDGGPSWYIRGETVDIPWMFVIDFFEWSKRTDPYLWPVRDGAEVGGGDGWSNGVQYAQELTRLIVRAGWAKPALGVHAAILVDPLAVVAEKYGVEL